MKKIISLLIALSLCIVAAAPVFAAENNFVPSISYKPTPNIVPVTGEDGEEYWGTFYDEDGQVIDYAKKECLIITPIAEALDEDSDIREDIRERLLDVYERLITGDMTIPFDKIDENLNTDDLVVRELIDVTLICEECKKLLEQDGVTLELTFDLGLDPNAEIYVMLYNPETGEWEPVKAVNNGDGTVTCILEHVGVLAFATKVVRTGGENPATGDSSNLVLWVVLEAVAAVGIVLLVVLKQKSRKATN